MYIEKNGESLPLDLLTAGEEGWVVDVIGDPTRVHQLAEIGLRKGSAVKMIRSGQPSLLAVDGRRLSIRLGNDVNVFVQPFLNGQAASSRAV